MKRRRVRFVADENGPRLLDAVSGDLIEGVAGVTLIASADTPLVSALVLFHHVDVDAIAELEP